MFFASSPPQDLDQSLVEALEIVQPGEHLLDVEEYKYKPEKPFKIKTEFEEAHDDSQVSPLGQSLESEAFQTLPQKPQSRRRKAVSSSTRHTAKRPRKKDLPLADTKNDDGFLSSIRKSFQDRSPMLLERVSLSPMLLNPQDLDSKKETLSRLKISPFRTLVGLSYKDASSSSSENCDVLRGRALAWSDPQADDDIKKQFETVTKVMQDLYGFSDADLFYR